jgi:hypothetical protein
MFRLTAQTVAHQGANFFAIVSALCVYTRASGSLLSAAASDAEPVPGLRFVLVATPGAEHIRERLVRFSIASPARGTI